MKQETDFRAGYDSLPPASKWLAPSLSSYEEWYQTLPSRGRNNRNSLTAAQLRRTCICVETGSSPSEAFRLVCGKYHFSSLLRHLYRIPAHLRGPLLNEWIERQDARKASRKAARQ